jgi:hypothetical protein
MNLECPGEFVRIVKVKYIRNFNMRHKIKGFTTKGDVAQQLADAGVKDIVMSFDANPEFDSTKYPFKTMGMKTKKGKKIKHNKLTKVALDVKYGKK